MLLLLLLLLRVLLLGRRRRASMACRCSAASRTVILRALSPRGGGGVRARTATGTAAAGGARVEDEASTWTLAGTTRRATKRTGPSQPTNLDLITIFTDFSLSSFFFYSYAKVRESAEKKRERTTRLQRSFFKFSRLRQTVDFVSTYEYAGVFKNVRRELLCAESKTRKKGPRLYT